MNIYINEEKKRPVSTSAVVRIIIWSLVLCVLVTLLAVGLSSKSEGMFFGISLNSFYYDDSGYSVGDGTSSARITDITVDWISGSVTIVPAEGNEISIAEDYRGEDSDLAVRWKVQNGELTVKYRAPSLIQSQIVDKNLTLAIPVAMLEGLGEVEVNGVDCDIRFEGNADELALEVAEGSLAVQGDIGELEIDAVNGTLDFKGAVRKASVDCVDVAIVMELDMATELNFDQVDGDVTLYLSEAITGFSAELDMVGGNLILEGFEGATSTGRESARWGDGSLRIRMDGVNCQLKVNKETKD